MGVGAAEEEQTPSQLQLLLQSLLQVVNPLTQQGWNHSGFFFPLHLQLSEGERRTLKETQLQTSSSPVRESAAALMKVW